MDPKTIEQRRRRNQEILQKMTMAKLISAQDRPFTIISPPDWNESYIKPEPKLSWRERIMITVGIIAVLVFCSLKV